MSSSLRYGAAALAAAILLTGCGGGASKGAASSSALAQLAAAQSSLARALAAVQSAKQPATAAGGSTVTGPAGAAASPGPKGTADIAAAASQGAGVIAGALGQLDVSKQCVAIPTGDVQALVKAPVGAAANLPLICGWKNTDLQVSLSPNDTDKKNYTNLLSTEGHAINGLGDEAQWSQPVPGATIPDVNARKGTLTCYVQSPGDITTTTLVYTGSDPFFKIKDADALAYASKEAKLCADIFSVS